MPQLVARFDTRRLRLSRNTTRSRFGMVAAGTTAIAVAVLLASCSQDKNVLSPKIAPPVAGPAFDFSTTNGNLNDQGGPNSCMIDDAKKALAIDSHQFTSGWSATTDPTETNNCTTNDVTLAIAEGSQYNLTPNAPGGGTWQNFDPANPPTCAGPTIGLRLNAHLVQGSQSTRHDFGIWIRTDAGDATHPLSAGARTGVCSHTNLPTQPLVLNTVDDDGDKCADMTAKGQTDQVPLGDIVVPCNPNGQGKLLINSCIAWKVPGDEGDPTKNNIGQCPAYTDATLGSPLIAGAAGFRYGTLPGNTSKCNCEGFTIDVFVPTNLAIQKATVGGTGSFNYTVNGSGLSPFSRNTATQGNPTNEAPFSFTPSQFGDKYVTETVPDGWLLTGISCSGTTNYSIGTGQGASFAAGATSNFDAGDNTVKVTIASGNTPTCTFTNTKRPQLTLSKHVINNNGGTADASAWTLSATGSGGFSSTGLPATGADASVGPNYVTAGVSYALSESGPSGYNAGAWSCVKNGGAPVEGASITLAAGDVAVCTITNDDQGPSLTLNKIINFTHGGTATESQWTLTADGGAAGTLTGPGAAGNADVVSGASFKAGTYTLSESAAPAGYTNGASYSCVKNGGAPVSGNSITLGLNDVAVCSITNIDIAPKLTLNKIINFTHGGTATEADWTLTANGGAAGTLTGPGAAGDADVVSGASFKAGTYALSESAAPAGYTNGANYSCVKNGGAPVSGNSITLVVGDVAVCSITNTDIAPKLTLNKIINFTHGGTATEADWTLTANGGAAGTLTGPGAAGNADVVSGASFKAGTYALSESAAPAGYTNGANYSCVKNGGAPVSGNSITLVVGDVAVCSITNTDIAPKLTLDKVTSYSYGGTAPESQWTLTANGGAAGTLTGPGAAGNADVVSGASFKAGTYTLSESAAPTGYQNGASYSCVKNAGAPVSGNSITLVVGDVAVCTITNTDLPATLTIVKTVKGIGGDFGFTGSANLSPSTFTLSPGQDGTVNKVYTGLSAGTYTMTEDDKSGFLLTDLGCTNTSDIFQPPARTVSITLPVGGSATCTFVNEARTSQTTRTQGYWATHKSVTEVIWFSGDLGVNHYNGVGDTNKDFCGVKTLDTIGKVLGGFWANIAQTSLKKKRSDVDHARMQLLQQLLAAILNNAAFASSPSGPIDIATAKARYCNVNSTVAQLIEAAGAMAQFNESGDSGVFTPGLSANGKVAKDAAEIPFWDKLP